MSINKAKDGFGKDFGDFSIGYGEITSNQEAGTSSTLLSFLPDLAGKSQKNLQKALTSALLGLEPFDKLKDALSKKGYTLTEELPSKDFVAADYRISIPVGKEGDFIVDFNDAMDAITKESAALTELARAAKQSSERDLP